MNALPKRSLACAAARVLAASAMAMTCAAASAQEDEDAQEPQALGPRLELSSEPVLRMDHVALPGTRVEAIGWAGGNVHAVGIALGSRVDRVESLPGQAPQLESSLSVGLRWRSALSDRRRVDVAAWRRGATATDPQAGLSTRIELQFTSPRTSVALADFGAIGMQLEGNARLQLRIRRGKPMFYYRSKF